MRSRRTLLGVWLLAAFLWTATPAPGQEVEIPEVFSETIDVRVVNVEVVVTDRQGNRVQGLKPSDFELLVDGEPTPIDYFTEIEDGLARGARDGDMAAVPSVDPNAPVGTNFLVFIDDLFSIKRDRNRVLDRLRDDLRTLRPVDRAAVVAFDGKRRDADGLDESVDPAGGGIGPRSRAADPRYEAAHRTESGRYGPAGEG